MITGNVISIDINKNEVTIIKDGFESCSNCKAGCSSKPPQSGMIIKAPIVPNLNIGDKVILDTTPYKRIASSIIIFLLPVISLLLGFYFANKINPKNELIGIFGAFLSCFVTTLLIILLYRLGFFNKLSGKIVKSEPGEPLDCSSCLK